MIVYVKSYYLGLFLLNLQHNILILMEIEKLIKNVFFFFFLIVLLIVFTPLIETFLNEFIEKTQLGSLKSSYFLF